MDTNRVSLIITIEDDCSTVKFKGECDGNPSDEQYAFTSAIYAAAMDVVQSDEVFTHYLKVAEQIADAEEREEKQPQLKLVH